MKLTVLSILILMLVAGLAMIQMDANTEEANTENQIQVLRETEMLTTQGLGTCEEVVNEPARSGGCADISCRSAGWWEITDPNMSQTIIVELFETQSGRAYERCGRFSWDTDCVPNPNTREHCATRILHYDPDCQIVYTSFPVLYSWRSDGIGLSL